MEVRSALFFEVLFMWWVGIRPCFVRSRMMMKSHFGSRDDDYVGSERSCESEDCAPCGRKNDLEDSSTPDSGSVKSGSTTFSDLGLISTSVQEVLTSKKEERPTGIEIYDVVSSMAGLTRTEVFKAVHKLINGDVEQFGLLKALPDEEKREWVYFLIDS